jgi:uncharacterized membrane protein YczE
MLYLEQYVPAEEGITNLDDFKLLQVQKFKTSMGVSKSQVPLLLVILCRFFQHRVTISRITFNCLRNYELEALTSLK